MRTPSASQMRAPAVVSRILSADVDGSDLQAQERDITVLFCDLVGFTMLCERLAPAELATVLNGFLTAMTEVVFEHEGTLDKFMGDALPAVFGAPLDQPDHALKAGRAALDMRRVLTEMNQRPSATPLEMRIAINTGMAITGDIGSPRRREFTVLGDTVNTAARIESESVAPGEIVIAGSTYDLVRDEVRARPLGAKTLRGRSTPIDLFAVLD
jgi:adenylate cyclase